MPENLEIGLLPADAAVPEPVAANTAAERAEETAEDQGCSSSASCPPTSSCGRCSRGTC
ncbi:hypothetical protein DIPPA_25725 [Diplonema papillatum]|nr:hypothetical protein DIPPA_25725 [Diplonema papillatum]